MLYLESLRIRARELPSLEFFKATLEAKIGLETELGALTFSLVKHLGLAVLGCLTLAARRAERARTGKRLRSPCLLVAFYAILGTYVIPQIIYRKSTGRGLLPLVPLFRVMALLMRPLTVGAQFPAIACSISATTRKPTKPHAGGTHRRADRWPAKKKASSKKATAS